MNAGPLPGSPGKLDAIAKARAAWGEAIPVEITVLAEACKAETSRAVAKRLGYSDAVVSHVLAAKYPGDMAKVLTKIRGALMGETVMCPILDEIGRDRCLSEQAKPFAATNSARARLFHACKSCPNRQQKDVA
ncbi:transcriptional regulator [Bosea sp. (in: a-proteobacteria)]|uniref:transcriptional regulator n=1 Tax=Bosea sp. (in: a-proteobacteria) TaxID=1871050 RepID=UPI001AC93221|nr:transcriptional regulator [Bosea sp. (in: a-proteobacteria)]MBN9438951.1 transcriptional regulator [Bosea sp. (in: a-proteobacteria)]